MNPLTLEWIEKAEGDFATAQREQRARKMPKQSVKQMRIWPNTMGSFTAS